MSQPFIGEIRLFPYNFAPRGWAFCQGQLLPIAQNTALFSLLGTTYGGNGTTNFALPDLRGRFPNSSGQGPGLADHALGEQGGAESRTLTQANLPSHNHSLGSTNTAASATRPGGNVPATGGSYAGTADNTMAPTIVGLTGGGQPFDTTPPYLTMNYCIALQGIFPSRN